MARKTASGRPDRAQLLVSRDEAKQKLQTQIDKGNALLEQPDGWSKESVKQRREEYNRWDKFNGSLLQSLFTTDEHRDSYHFGLGGRTEFRSLAEEVSELMENIRSAIRKIQSVQDVVDLTPLDVSVQPHSPPTVVPIIGGPLRNGKQMESNKVFIVHGHDDTARLEVSNVLQKLRLQPIVLNEQLNQGRTIIEKIEAHSDVAFAIVLLTPDDVGNSKADYETDTKVNWRARQNVIFEMGYFYAKLTRAHVCALLKGNTETPSDISGVVYTDMDDRGAWKTQLANEMKAAGLRVSLDDL